MNDNKGYPRQVWTSLFLTKTELRKYIMKDVYNRFKNLEWISEFTHAAGKRRKYKGITFISVNYFQGKSTLFSSVSPSGYILKLFQMLKNYFWFGLFFF